MRFDIIAVAMVSLVAEEWGQSNYLLKPEVRISYVLVYQQEKTDFFYHPL